MAFTERLRHAWDAFNARDPTKIDTREEGYANFRNEAEYVLSGFRERTIIASIYNRIAIDCASIEIRHVRTDQNGRYMEDINDDFNKCLTLSSNLDQAPRTFFQDVVLSMFDEGHVAIFPDSADYDILETGSYKIFSLRRGRIVEWYPKSVRLEAYDANDGHIKQIIMPKDRVAIMENPFYSVMNAPNSTLQRLLDKLNLLDRLDNKQASGKLDLLIQLPYVTRTEIKKKEAETRRKEVENQLTNSKYGVAYIDGTERVVQLNRPIENNLLEQIDYLTKQLYTELGITEGIFNGTATEEEQLRYTNSTIEPIVACIVDEMKRKFLTNTARTQGQSVMYFRDPFKLAPVSQVAELGDKLTRNEILTSNEFRAILGYKPSSDPKADELRNSNIAASKQEVEERIAPRSNTDDEPLQE